MVTCEKSLVSLLPDEVGLCSLTNKRVDKRLLQACAATDQLALQSEMVQSKAMVSGFFRCKLRSYPMVCPSVEAKWPHVRGLVNTFALTRLQTCPLCG